MNRRSLLRIVGALGVGGLAGCSESSDEAGGPITKKEVEEETKTSKPTTESPKEKVVTAAPLLKYIPKDISSFEFHSPDVYRGLPLELTGRPINREDPSTLDEINAAFRENLGDDAPLSSSEISQFVDWEGGPLIWKHNAEPSKIIERIESSVSTNPDDLSRSEYNGYTVIFEDGPGDCPIFSYAFTDEILIWESCIEPYIDTALGNSPRFIEKPGIIETYEEFLIHNDPLTIRYRDQEGYHWFFCYFALEKQIQPVMVNLVKPDYSVEKRMDELRVPEERVERDGRLIFYRKEPFPKLSESG